MYVSYMHRNRMHWVVIPMCGRGQRFRDAGYVEPKALIPLMGRALLFHVLDGLPAGTNVRLICSGEYERCQIKDRVVNEFSALVFDIVFLHQETRGAAETVLLGVRDLGDSTITCMDCDTVYHALDITGLRGNSVCTFRDDGETSQYSFVDVKSGVLTRIVEKERISNVACTGIYSFSSSREFVAHASAVISSNIRNRGEFYMSTVIQHMITAGVQFHNHSMNVDEFTVAGTPIQLRVACIRLSKTEQSKKRFCFDLDGTLVTPPDVPGDYTTVRPIERNIMFLRQLKSMGHHIIVHTARRMRTHHGNVAAVTADIGMITLRSMRDLNIPYDEFMFGKPYADFYIDDKAVHSNSDVQRDTGFYVERIAPRSFHSMTHMTMKTIRKHGSDLSAEISFYQKLPVELRHLFPCMLSYDTQNTWYDMQYVEGLPISNLYTSALLTKDHLLQILDGLDQIHRASKNAEHIDSKQNYIPKLLARTTTHPEVYSRYSETSEFIDALVAYFDEYVPDMVCIIHGDPVFTNIVLEHDNTSLRFIDPRGKMGDQLTPYGDALYDYAKVYQSLIGYDEILLNKSEVSPEYRRELVTAFESTISCNMLHVKWITCLLLFSLLPLHEERVANECFALLRREIAPLMTNTSG